VRPAFLGRPRLMLPSLRNLQRLQVGDYRSVDEGIRSLLETVAGLSRSASKCEALPRGARGHVGSRRHLRGARWGPVRLGLKRDWADATMLGAHLAAKTRSASVSNAVGRRGSALATCHLAGVAGPGWSIEAIASLRTDSSCRRALVATSRKKWFGAMGFPRGGSRIVGPARDARLLRRKISRNVLC